MELIGTGSIQITFIKHHVRLWRIKAGYGKNRQWCKGNDLCLTGFNGVEFERQTHRHEAGV